MAKDIVFDVRAREAIAFLAEVGRRERRADGAAEP